MKISAEAYQPRTHQVYWCHHCDCRQVDSQKGETGKFFVFFGHSYDFDSGEYDGDYHGVMFALCADCLKE